MDKNEFLRRLEKALTDLTETDRKEIRYDYEEHFRNASAAGKTEVEIINSLGAPEFIAKQYLAGNSGKTLETSPSRFRMANKVLTKVRPGFVNFCERITGNSLVFGLVIALLMGILTLEVFTLIGQNRVLASQKDYQHRSLIAVIKQYQREAKFNQGAFVGLMKIAEKAKHNRGVIKTAAYILANAGFNSSTVLEIAKIAGSADHEVSRLNDLMEVAITYGIDNPKMVELARKAVNNEISKSELENALKYYRSHSRAKTIEEAEKNMEQAFENL